LCFYSLCLEERTAENAEPCLSVLKAQNIAADRGKSPAHSDFNIKSHLLHIVLRIVVATFLK
jgi:hypothetical protein